MPEFTFKESPTNKKQVKDGRTHIVIDQDPDFKLSFIDEDPIFSYDEIKEI